MHGSHCVHSPLPHPTGQLNRPTLPHNIPINDCVFLQAFPTNSIFAGYSCVHTYVCGHWVIHLYPFLCPRIWLTNSHPYHFDTLVHVIHFMISVPWLFFIWHGKWFNYFLRSWGTWFACDMNSVVCLEGNEVYDFPWSLSLPTTSNPALFSVFNDYIIMHLVLSPDESMYWLTLQ
jgi:hypothetical protein